jgi:hypothetical protein
MNLSSESIIPCWCSHSSARNVSLTERRFMKKRSLAAVLCLMLCLVFAIGAISNRILATQPDQARTKKDEMVPGIHKWEFMVIRASNHDDLVNRANSLGDQGWELVGPPCDNAFVAYFKRAKS